MIYSVNTRSDWSPARVRPTTSNQETKIADMIFSVLIWLVFNTCALFALLLFWEIPRVYLWFYSGIMDFGIVHCLSFIALLPALKWVDFRRLIQASNKNYMFYRVKPSIDHHLPVTAPSSGTMSHINGGTATGSGHHIRSPTVSGHCGSTTSPMIKLRRPTLGRVPYILLCGPDNEDVDASIARIGHIPRSKTNPMIKLHELVRECPNDTWNVPHDESDEGLMEGVEDMDWEPTPDTCTLFAVSTLGIVPEGQGNQTRLNADSRPLFSIKSQVRSTPHFAFVPTRTTTTRIDIGDPMDWKPTPDPCSTAQVDEDMMDWEPTPSPCSSTDDIDDPMDWEPTPDPCTTDQVDEDMMDWEPTPSP